ncbi:MAG: bifunctional oligoribonuclease/PAP phosphatase NrnA [Bacteroidetes bacterium]|nr:bifunctional oligoribonuclease/PAP phosphatase NrnA [Bacteroidota bacterium]
MNKSQVEQVKKIKKLLSEKRKIVITTHNNPDGDAIGSSMALYHFLKKQGHKVDAIVPNMYPQFLAWIPGADKMIVYENKSAKSQALLAQAEIVFSLDYNAIHRTGSLADILLRTEAKKILIDHHIDPETDSFDHCISTVDTSSTAELVYNFIDQLGGLDLIDKPIAESLYAGIVTDTGSFSFSCNRKETFEVTANLISRGVDAQKLHRLIYDTFSENRLRLLGYSINNRMIVWEEFNTALIYLTKADLKKFDYRVGDTEGIVNYPLTMEKINQSILLTEKEKMIRMSFRSKGKFSVNDFVRKHFNGGGHMNAAGGKSFTTIDKTIDEIKKILPAYKKQLNYKLNYNS